MRNALSALLVAGLIGVSGAAQAAVVFSDNFNSDTQGIPQNTLANWTVTIPSVDVIGTGFFDFYPGNGNYLDMTGTPGAGEITSNAVFAPGTYTLSFDYGNNTGTASASLQIMFGSFLASVVSNSPSVLLSYTSPTIVLTAPSQLVLTSLTGGPGGNAGFVLDNVVLRSTDPVVGVPAPAAFALFGMAIAGLALVRRR